MGRPNGGEGVSDCDLLVECLVRREDDDAETILKTRPHKVDYKMRSVFDER